ncbi:MAG: hypothetical protein M3Y59_19640 [Myxococcota bacterium]|nr:hypothetical protein [Myxococcota bacterium]
MSLPRRVGTLAVLSIFAVGCDLLDIAGSENAVGRGSTVFDPYRGPGAAIKLGLEVYNGCAILPNGDPIGPGGLTVPYPAECENFNLPAGTKIPPGSPMPILTGTDYFLDKFAIVDTVEDLHTNPGNMVEVTEWLTNQTTFAGLDWSQLSKVDENWLYSDGITLRTIQFGNAAWQLDLTQTFTVELFDSAGGRKSQVEYARSEFLSENAQSGHSRFAWSVFGGGAPQGPGETIVRPAPFPVGEGPPVTFRTIARFEVAGSANPFKSLRVESGLSGEGFIKVTWSALPDKPFYFPVQFVEPEELPTDCFSIMGAPTPCDFGLEPEVTFSAPTDQVAYAPGEAFSFTIGFKDGAGNYLHPSEALPSYGEFMRSSANGLLYRNPGHIERFQAQDTETMVRVYGPLQDMETSYGYGQRKFFMFPEGNELLPSLIPTLGLLPGAFEFKPATRNTVTLPPDATPGTYAVVVKGNRGWMGERFAKQATFQFQVGQAAPTQYPSQVGNCQICHRGVISLDNIRHGESVDNIEGCKSCHNLEVFSGLFGPSIHSIHMKSTRYTSDKSDCSVCHLTRASATRPSVAGCSTCHLGLHGNSYFDLQFKEIYEAPNTYGNCAQACHVQTTPSQHILPPL